MFRSKHKPWFLIASASGAFKGTTSGRMGLLTLFVVAILAISAALPAKASPATQSSSFTFTASSDSQVQEANPAANYGRTSDLLVDGNSSNRAESYIFFAVTGLRGPISEATLRVYDADNGSTNGPMLYGTATSWTEAGITWNNRPSRTTPLLDNKGIVSVDNWVEYDVSAHVTTGGTYSFVLVADSDDGLVFSSREGERSPQLLVTTTFRTTLEPTPTEPPSEFPVLVGAGDIAFCSNLNDELTAQLLESIPGTVFTLGDNAYTSGTSAEYTNCYDPTWGTQKSRTKPVPGNHEYNTSGAAGYFGYFENIEPYYAYDLGTWRIYALNSEIDVSATSAQVRWLESDLADNPGQCVLAYWHQPRWSSGKSHGSNASLQAVWETLYDAGAELVLNGHEHVYERFAQMDASGSIARQGLREIVVGTGGAGLYEFGQILPTSEVRSSSAHGVLKLTLKPTGYDWQFIPVLGKTFTDSGTDTCH